MLGSVYVNDIQNNPLQPDINYRGYTASPLLGTPQGLSVYMDGVRLNQPFGDVVSWDLIPRVAISSLDADAGLESAVRPQHARRRAVRAHQGRLRRSRQQRSARLRLGQPLAARVRDRRSRGQAGSTGMSRATISKRTAGATTRLPTHRRLLGKLGWRSADTDLSLTGAYADTDLNGNGLQEQRFLAATTRASTPSPTTRRTSRACSTSRLASTVNDALSFSGNALLSRHQDVDVQRRHQRRLAGRERLPAERRPSRPRSRPRATRVFRRAARTRRTRRFPSWRCIANVAAQHRAEREVQRTLQPHAHRSRATAASSGQLTWSTRARRPPEPVHRRRGVRQEPRAFHAVVAVRLPHAGSRRRDGRRARRLRRRHAGLRERVRRARRPHRPHEHEQRVRERFRRSELAP